MFSCQISKIFKSTFFKEHLGLLLLYILYTHDVKCNLSRWNNGCNGKEKSSFKMLGLTFSSKLDWVSYIISIAKTASKKIGALIRSMKFLSPEVALYLYKSTIHPCMEYCCLVWAGAPSCYLELLDKLQKRICRIVRPSHLLNPWLIVEMWPA